MTIDQFFDEYLNKTVGYPTGSYVGECLSLAKWFIKEVYGINPPPSGCGGARCYWTIFPNPLGDTFEKIPNTREFVPQRGDIIVWDENTGGGYGHIAICTGEGDLNYFVSLDQNWGGRHAHYVRHGYEHVYGVLRAKNRGGTMNIEESVFNELVSKATKYDEFASEGYTDVNDVLKLEQQRNDREAERNAAESRVKELEKEIGNHQCETIDTDSGSNVIWTPYKKVEELVGTDLTVRTFYTTDPSFVSRD